MAPKPRPIADLHADKFDIDEDTGCWTWNAYVADNGYGMAWDGVRRSWAHRVIYLAVVGHIDPGLQLDHLCRNRACVNPDHLEPVTPRENLRRSSMPALNAARFAAITHCKHGHERTEANLGVRVQADGTTRRWCRPCGAASQRARRARSEGQ